MKTKLNKLILEDVFDWFKMNNIINNDYYIKTQI
jgi:hypothetical protein